VLRQGRALRKGLVSLFVRVSAQGAFRTEFNCTAGAHLQTQSTGSDVANGTQERLNIHCGARRVQFAYHASRHPQMNPRACISPATDDPFPEVAASHFTSDMTAAGQFFRMSSVIDFPPCVPFVRNSYQLPQLARLARSRTGRC
jgi:hypothetical protein